MKYVSLDIETTSLKPHPDQVLSIAVVLEDSEKPIPVEQCPYFACIIQRERYEGDPYALYMNAELLKVLGQDNPHLPGYELATAENWTHKLKAWLEFNVPPKPHVAGANVGSFDLQFFPPEIRALFHYRTIEIGSAFIDWKQKSPPSLNTIVKALGIRDNVTHDALEDARDVIRALRKTYV